MKKYLIFVGLLLSVIGLSYYCCDIDGRLYLPVSNQSAIRTVFYIKDKRIYDQRDLLISSKVLMWRVP